MVGSLLSAEQRQSIAAIKDTSTNQVIKRCALILLSYDDGLATRQIAGLVQLSPSQVRRRRRQFCLKGMQIFPLENISEDISLSFSEQEFPEFVIVDEPENPQEQILLSPYSLENFIADAALHKSPGIERNDTLAEAARKILRFQFAQMLLKEEGTRLGEDIEALHDMRVATRRMRAALDIFNDSFTPKTIKTLFKGLRQTGRRLGRVRDQDVFIDNARRYLLTLPEEQRQGLNPLIANWEDARQNYRQDMLAHLNSKAYREFKENFLVFVNTPGAGVRTQTNGILTPRLVREIAPQLIYSCLADVRAFEPIIDTATLPQFHALRIAFKKFRYAIEFFQEVLGQEVRQVINDLKKIQDHLGELNDAQVATLILRDYLGEWDIQQQSIPVVQRSSPEPVMAYLSAVYARRQTLMDTFRPTWEHFNRPEFRQNLGAAVAAL